jgi:hypothetical protein
MLFYAIFMFVFEETSFVGFTFDNYSVDDEYGNHHISISSIGFVHVD